MTSLGVFDGRSSKSLCHRVCSVAADVGYDSEAAFNRAFKRELGTTPAAWRRARNQPQQHLPAAPHHGR